MLEPLVKVLFLLGRNEQAEPLARQLLASASEAVRRARMAWTLAYTLLRTKRIDEALAVADGTLALAGLPPEWAARHRSLRALLLANATRYDEAREAAAGALAAAERAGDPLAAGYALHTVSMAQLHDGDVAGYLATLEHALAVIGEDPETTDLRLLLLGNRLAGFADLGREATAEAREVVALAERTGTARIGVIRWMAAQYLWSAGRWDEALAELDALFGMGTDLSDAILPVAGRGLAALICVHRDDRAGVQAHLRAMHDQPPLTGRDRMFGGYLLCARALLAEQDGRAADAVALLAPTFSPGSGGDMAQEGGWLPDLVRCALGAGDTETAALAVARYEQEAVRHGGPVMRAIARRCRGLADADPHPLGEAVAYYRGISRPLDLAQALEDLAAVLAASSELMRARAALAEAAEIYTGLGATWDLVRADARLRRHGVRRRRSGTRRPATGWAALTPTETKIAYLVGEGLSNPDIAARMFVSRYTIQVHVSRILAKLGAHSRAEIARHRPGTAG
jgi:DNA-binding CsgD family transcriptional regulator